MAILPGMCKGAEKTKMIVPQTALVGFGLVVFPLLQLPMLGTVMCIMVQVCLHECAPRVTLRLCASGRWYVEGLWSRVALHDRPD